METREILYRLKIKQDSVSYTHLMRVSYNFTGNVQFPYLKDYNMLNAAQKLEYERLAGLYSTEVKRDPWGNITNEGEQYALDKLYNERYQEVQRGVDTDWLSQPARTAFSHDHSLRCLLYTSE